MSYNYSCALMHACIHTHTHMHATILSVCMYIHVSHMHTKLHDDIPPMLTCMQTHIVNRYA